MKKLIPLILFCSIYFFGCTTEEKTDFTIISGTVEISDTKHLQLKDKDYKKVKSISIKKDGSFYDTLYIPKGYYILSTKNEYQQVFLKPGFNLEINVKKQDQNIIYNFKGIGSNENNYLIQKKEFANSFKKVEQFEYYLNLSEDNFLKLSDSIFREKLEFLQTYKFLNSDFTKYETFYLHYKNGKFISYFPKWKAEYIKDENYRVSKSFPNPYNQIDPSEEDLLVHPNYLGAVGSLLSYNLNESIPEDSLLSELEKLESNVKSQRIKDELAYRSTWFILQGNNRISNSAYLKYMSIVKNKEYLKKIELTHQEMSKLKKGLGSPKFEFYDINDNLVTLDDLKGKLVYIDIWATWCFPCIKEIPALKKLEKEFKNEGIHFVSMCLKDSEKNFKKMVKEKELGGIQLFTPNPDDSFFKAYNLNKIPRFILIDQEGKILDAYAFNPSDPKLKKQLDELLKIQS